MSKTLAVAIAGLALAASAAPAPAGTYDVWSCAGPYGEPLPADEWKPESRGGSTLYRILRSFAPFTYRFRARLMRQASYPYAGGASRIVTVKIVR